jgi:hypothetical protein
MKWCDTWPKRSGWFIGAARVKPTPDTLNLGPLKVRPREIPLQVDSCGLSCCPTCHPREAR